MTSSLEEGLEHSPKTLHFYRETGFTSSIWPKRTNIKCPTFIEDTVRPKRTVSPESNCVFGSFWAVCEVRRSPKLAFFGVFTHKEGPKSWHGVFNKDGARSFSGVKHRLFRRRPSHTPVRDRKGLVHSRVCSESQKPGYTGSELVCTSASRAPHRPASPRKQCILPGYDSILSPLGALDCP